MTHTDDHRTDEHEQELLNLLKELPMPAASAEFYDQALVRATHEGTRRQRNRWVMTGFGSAIAAGLAVLLISGLFFDAPRIDTVDPNASIPGVTMALAEPRTVNLMFASTEALESATLTVSLPDGIELAGFPGQREITWETNLSAGKNYLPLKLIALTPAGGEVLARLEHNDRDRTFRLQVNVS